MTKITVKGENGSCQSPRKPGPETQEPNPMPRFALRPLALAGIMALVAVVIGAQAPSPPDIETVAAQIAVKLVERILMANPQIDDEIAEKWCRNFIKDL